KGAIQAYPELYFAKLVVLGEGDSEELLLPKFFDLLGKEVDSSQISIVPLGGRHVNYFWKLLNALRIPHITLLDFDNERYGGGWGRIKYISQHLYELNTEFQEWFHTQRLDFNEIGSRGCESIGAQRLINWFNKLEEFNVYFSSPLDIDFLMLQHYKDNYLNTLSPIEGPVVSYNDSDGSSKKVKLSDLDCLDRLQLEGFNKRKEEAIRATLKDKSGHGDSFNEEEKELMIWYQYFFLGRGKPTTHMQFLSSISDD
ncbi:TPA: ATP-dependent endonuclease, partial [Streptococcus pneumoniae]